MNQNPLNVHALLQNVASGTTVLVRDEILEDQLYYEGTAGAYFQKVMPLENLRVENIAIQEGRLVISAIAVATV